MSRSVILIANSLHSQTSQRMSGGRSKASLAVTWDVANDSPPKRKLVCVRSSSSKIEPRQSTLVTSLYYVNRKLTAHNRGMSSTTSRFPTDRNTLSLTAQPRWRQSSCAAVGTAERRPATNSIAYKGAEDSQGPASELISSYRQNSLDYFGSTQLAAFQHIFASPANKLNLAALFSSAKCLTISRVTATTASLYAYTPHPFALLL